MTWLRRFIVHRPPQKTKTFIEHIFDDPARDPRLANDGTVSSAGPVVLPTVKIGQDLVRLVLVSNKADIQTRNKIAAQVLQYYFIILVNAGVGLWVRVVCMESRPARGRGPPRLHLMRDYFPTRFPFERLNSQTFL